MAKELVNLSNKLENMQNQLKDYPSLQEKFNVIFNNIEKMYFIIIKRVFFFELEIKYGI